MKMTFVNPSQRAISEFDLKNGVTNDNNTTYVANLRNDNASTILITQSLQDMGGRIERLDIDPIWNAEKGEYSLNVSFQNPITGIYAQGQQSAFSFKAEGKEESAALLGLLYGMYKDSDVGFPSDQKAAILSVLAGLKFGCDNNKLGVYFDGHGGSVFYDFQQAFQDNRPVNLIVNGVEIVNPETSSMELDGHCGTDLGNLIFSVHQALLSVLGNRQEFSVLAKSGREYNFKYEGTAGPNYTFTGMPQGGSYDEMAEAFVRGAGFNEQWFIDNRGDQILKHFEKYSDVAKAGTREKKLEIAARKAMYQLVETMKNIFIQPNMGEAYGNNGKGIQPVLVISPDNRPDIQNYDYASKTIKTEQPGDTVGLIVQTGDGSLPLESKNIMVYIQPNTTWRQVIANILDLPNVNDIENFSIFKAYAQKMVEAGFTITNFNQAVDVNKTNTDTPKLFKLPTPPSVIKTDLVVNDPL